MPSQNIKEMSDFFNEYWQSYKNFVMENRMYHHEMFAALNHFLHKNMGKQPFSFVEVGCGDSSTIYPILLDNPIQKYIGIDVAEKVLKMAHTNLANLNCEKKFIFDNMTNAIKNLQCFVDIIFSSHAVHHLSYQEKVDFIYHCKNRLAPNGFLIIIEGILEENQTRDQLLEEVEEFYKATYPQISTSELKRLMHHHRTRVFPEQIATFTSIAHQLGWEGFRVILRIGAMAFMVFSKSDRLIHSIKDNFKGKEFNNK